ncbi:type VII secretion integral membrane protein EccD [Gordonia aichiensis]|uniref:type VII secretion integral membrane protein EccD n=3 Tax=Gordonia TaxID=2053 RepID=UPI0032657378
MTVFAEPELVRISILGTDRQLDVGLPATVPIAALMPDILAALRLPMPDHAAPQRWTLARIDGVRLAPDDSLARCGVLDGDLLIVRADRPGPRSALVDDVADGVAALLADDRAGWSADSSRLVGYAVFLLATMVAIPAARWTAAAGERPAAAALTGVGAAVALGVALAGARLRLDPRTTAVLAVGGCLLAAAAASLAVEAPAGAQVTLAALAAGTCAVIGHRATALVPAVPAAFVATAIPAAVAGTLSAVSGLSVGQVAAVTAALGVLTMLTAPRSAIAAGRLPLPAVPTTPPVPSADAAAPVDGIGALPLPSNDPLAAIADLALGDTHALARRARLTASLLTGLLVGAVITVGASTVIAAATAHGSAVTLVFCACAVAALSARGRTHTDRLQSAVLVGGAGLTALAAVLAVLLAGSGPGPLTILIAVIVAGTAALLLGTVAAGASYSPPAVRAAEIVEYAVLIALIPLLLWVLEVYQTVREL